MAFFLQSFNSMRRGRHYKAGLTAAVAAVIAGISMVFLLYAWSFNAEAAGNLGNLNNPHNLSVAGLGSSITAQTETRICIFCHTPHHADITEALVGPLWNHAMTAVASYDYTNIPSTLVNAVSMPLYETVDGATKMCMSCHDGTVAVGALTGGVNITMVGAMAPSAILGTTPSHHIFSVPLNDNLINDSIASCAGGATSTRLKYPWASTATAPANAGVVLSPTAHTYEGVSGVSGESGTPPAPDTPYDAGSNYGVQCNTCHDPHYYHTNGPLSCKFMTGGSCVDYYDPLCLACHAFDC